MLKKVKIKVKSTVSTEGDPTPECTEETASGYLKYTAEGVSLLSYKTDTEGGPLTTELFREGNTVRLVRRGALLSEIVFEVGKEHSSLYKVPPMSFDMTVKTRRLEWNITASGGRLSMLYSMCIGGVSRLARMEVAVTTTD